MRCENKKLAQGSEKADLIIKLGQAVILVGKHFVNFAEVCFIVFSGSEGTWIREGYVRGTFYLGEKGTANFLN